MKQTISSEQISSLDPTGARRHLFLAEVSGKWRKYRTTVQTLLIFVFLVTPWTYWNGKQTILLNILEREFSFFGTVLHAHDAPILFFLLAGGALSLAFVTSVWGRVWCGWTCPQTVFIDGVFRRIEYWIEGDYLKRAALANADLSFGKVFKKSLKWILFLFAAGAIAHSFLAYFVGSYRFIDIIQLGPAAHPTIFKFALFFTALFLFDFAWLKEQFCTVACPYGRIQGLLIDKNSVAVEFNLDRKQDCISCQRCVNVCPMGIDIRNGLQMECIQCTACIDACDDIMDKVKKPSGLIRYATLDHAPINFKKPRTLLYGFAIAACFIGLFTSLSLLRHTQVFVLRAVESPYKEIETASGEKKIINHFRLQVSNQSLSHQKYKVILVKPAGAELILQSSEFELAPKEFKEVHLFIQGPVTSEFVGSEQTIKIYDVVDPLAFSKEHKVKIIGPSGL